MRPSRRDILLGAGVSATTLGLMIGFRAFETKPFALAVYDRRICDAWQFSKSAMARGARIIDIADEETRLWKTVRASAATPGAVAGLTGWSDFVTLKGVYEQQGKRLRSLEKAADASFGPRRVTPYLWVMA